MGGSGSAAHRAAQYRITDIASVQCSETILSPVTKIVLTFIGAGTVDFVRWDHLRNICPRKSGGQQKQSTDVEGQTEVTQQWRTVWPLHSVQLKPEELISSSSFWFFPSYKVFNCTVAFNRARVYKLWLFLMSLRSAHRHTGFVCLTIDFCGAFNIMQGFFLPLLTSCDCADSTFYRRINFPLEAVPRVCESLGQFLIEIRWRSLSSEFGDRLPPSETFRLRSQPTNSPFQDCRGFGQKGKYSSKEDDGSSCNSIFGLLSARLGTLWNFSW